MEYWRRIEAVRAYGAEEIMRGYKVGLRRSFVYSVVLHLCVIGIYWIVLSAVPREPEAKQARILKYEEFELSFVSTPSPEVLPGVPLSSPTKIPPGYAGTRQASKPKGVQTRRASLPGRSFADNLLDLPSSYSSDKINPGSLAGETNALMRGSDVAGGRNNSPPNDVRGGVPQTSVRGESPAGSARSGIGSSSKPAPDDMAPTGSSLYGFRDGGEGGTGFSMSWFQGGTRKKISGELPKYPEGAKVEAEIVLRAVVTPSGSVKSIQVAQRGNSKLEDAAVKEVRFWKFEPLKSASPQVDQTCTLKFLFKLK